MEYRKKHMLPILSELKDELPGQGAAAVLRAAGLCAHGGGYHGERCAAYYAAGTGGVAVTAGDFASILRGGGRVSPPPGASIFLSSLKESCQRKPLKTTFQDFLGAGTSRCCACGRGMGRFVPRHE